ncbi:hypothetical protein AA0116_g13273 [Alternaria tenuissima]|nr:hypothetical protein AA0116_g13273 [Alternaria tenuissima]
MPPPAAHNSTLPLLPCPPQLFSPSLAYYQRRVL